MEAKGLFMRMALLPLRLRIAFSYLCGSTMQIAAWLVKSREHTNFTYDLTELNERYLACFIGEITQQPLETIQGYLQEIKNDVALKAHVSRLTRASRYKYKADEQPKFGRRVGWYALVRAIKPKVVVETGVDKGLGSCVLAAALMRNAEEGFAGFLYGTDINPEAGYLLQTPYERYGKVLYGDSIQTLEKLAETIDLFINDSDHSTEYEMREYRTVSSKLSKTAIVVGDNSHFSDKLLNFANETGRRFLFFKEQPMAHWYPGGGIGIAYSDQSEKISNGL